MMWQVSSKKEQGAPMELLEFKSLWRAADWLIRNLLVRRIIVIVKIEE